MSDLRIDTAIEQLLAILQEAMDGATGGSWFIDSGDGSGLLPSLARIDAASASKPVAGSSIAAHAHHLAFGMEASAAWIRGERTPRNWKESWRRTVVDDDEWPRLQEELTRRYHDLRSAIQSHAADGAESIGGAIGALAHVAYHLAAIRQKYLCSALIP